MCLNRCITLKSPLLEPVREDGAETFNIDPEGRFDALHGGNARWRLYSGTQEKLRFYTFSEYF